MRAGSVCGCGRKKEPRARDCRTCASRRVGGSGGEVAQRIAALGGRAAVARRATLPLSTVGWMQTGGVAVSRAGAVHRLARALGWSVEEILAADARDEATARRGKR